MAERYWNVPLGVTMNTGTNIAEGAADTSQYVAVRCTYTATGNSKLALIQALEAVIQYVTKDPWPPV